jgi:hypothetical protein
MNAQYRRAAAHGGARRPPKNRLDAALNYAARGLPVFPCQWQGERRKRPLVKRGLYAASRDPTQIGDWWEHWPEALIGLPTGRASGFVVLDVDTRGAGNGFDTLANLGFAILPETPMGHTTSGGLHLYFEAPKHPEISNTAGERGSGIGRGLDWRGGGGYVIAPSPGSGYSWDPHWNLDTVPLAPVPAGLLPHERERWGATARSVMPSAGLSPYAEAALDGACRAIIAAPDGAQEATLNAEAFAIGTLAGASAIPTDFALKTLLWAARQIRDHDPRRPWRTREIETKVERSFVAGTRRPRKARHA